jgi:hypothetical protein
MIAFEHGALQRYGEPLLAGILVHGVLEVSDAQVVTLLAHVERLTVDEWAEILTSAHERRAERLPAVRRLRDAIAMDEPSVIGMLANVRISTIARTLEQELRDEDREAAGVVRFAGAVVTQLTASSYAIERRGELGAADVVQLYAPFERVIPLASLG